MDTIERKNIISLFKPVWFNISKKRKRQVLISINLIILNGILDLISVTSVLPLLYLLTSNPEAIMENLTIKRVVYLLNINNSNELLILSTILFAFVALFSGFIRLFNLYFNNRLSGAIASDISVNAFSNVLFQPYKYHINLNSSEVISSITSHMNNLSAGLTGFMMFITGLILSAFTIFGLFLINWKLSLLGFLIYSFLYLIIAINGKKRLNRNSKFVAKTNINIVKSIQESLGSIKDIILDNLHRYYISTHKEYEYSMRRLIAQNMVITAFPRYAIEALTLVFISLLILYRGSIFSDEKTIIPTLGALAIGMQKILPAFQSLYTSWAIINGQKESIFKLLKFIDLQNENKLDNKDNFLKSNNKIIKLLEFKSLELCNVSFNYDNNKELIFEGLNLKIRSGEKIGIIGKTGDGKSTLLDIIMGLIEPSKGKILLNGRNLNQDKSLLRQWRKKLSHVPQNIYLVDKSISENIVLGNQKNVLKLEKIRHAAKLAQIEDFINQAPMEFETKVGEDGIKISGGQRQRIGIARALYKNPFILVLDEATSALDEETERLIMESIMSINKKMTVLVVAHRLKTMKYCDRVIKIKKGKIVFDGDPSEII